MRQNLISAGVCVVAGVVFGVVFWPQSPVVAALLIGAGAAAGGWLALATMRREPHIPWSQAAAQIAPDRAVVLWKPTCRYCTRLRRALRDDERVVWVNVWADLPANAKVRALNAGDEYTPTVVVGERVLRNPTADEVRAALTG